MTQQTKNNIKDDIQMKRKPKLNSNQNNTKKIKKENQKIHNT